MILCIWGTLLGIIRENGFIRHDDDIDISILNDNVSFDSLIMSLNSRGFKFVHAIVADKKILYYTFSVHGVHVDFFCEFSGPRPGVVYSPETRPPANGEYSGFKTPWVLVELKDGGLGELRRFHDIEIMVPCNPYAVVESMYGATWQIPDPNCKFGKVYKVMNSAADRITDINHLKRLCND